MKTAEMLTGAIQILIVLLAVVSFCLFSWLGLRALWKRGAALAAYWGGEDLLRLVALIALILLLLFALDRQPYAYYHFLRIAVFAACVFIGFEQRDLNYWTATFFVLGILYNPLIPPRFTREIWETVNLATLVLFVAYWWFHRRAKAPLTPPG